MSCHVILVNDVCRRTFDILLADAEERPEVKDPEIGAQNSTGK